MQRTEPLSAGSLVEKKTGRGQDRPDQHPAERQITEQRTEAPARACRPVRWGSPEPSTEGVRAVEDWSPCLLRCGLPGPEPPPESTQLRARTKERGWGRRRPWWPLESPAAVFLVSLLLSVIFQVEKLYLEPVILLIVLSYPLFSLLNVSH